MSVKVRLFGLLRLDTGIRELELEAGSVRELYPKLAEELRRRDENCPLKEKDLRGCVVSVNDRLSKPGTRLKDGDVVCLIPPVAGG